MMPDLIPQQVRDILFSIHDAGFRVWLVGGALRDHYLGITPKDWDVATDAPAVKIMELFPRVIPVGIRHGTVMVHSDLGDVEVTSLQGPDKLSIERDLARRDFTFNAMAVLYPDGVLLDPFEGLKDLQSRVLRAVANPHQRFKEDPLRIVRAARFMSHMGFKVHPDTRAGIPSGLPGLPLVAGERIRDEILKILAGNGAPRAFSWLRRVKALEQVLPELARCFTGTQAHRHFGGIFGESLRTLDACPPQPLLKLAALLGPLGKCGGRGVFRRGHMEQHWRERSARMAVEVMSRWHMAKRDIRRVEAVIRHQPPGTARLWSGRRLRRYLAEMGREVLEDVLEFAWAQARAGIREKSEIKTLEARIRAELWKHPPLSVRDLHLTGSDVMRLLHLEPGPRVGSVLRRLHELVLEDPSRNTVDDLESLVVQMGRDGK